VRRRSPAFLALPLAASLLASPAAAQRASALPAPPLRPEPAVTYGAPPGARAAAWDRFLRAAGAAGRPRAWQALWNRDTLAPVRILGAGLPAPGVGADDDAALAHARATLDAHRDLLAPGTRATDLELATNEADAGLRTVTFLQRVPVAGAGLVPVVGGRLGFRYEHDRLVVLAAETFPAEPLPAPRLDAAAAVAAATAWIAADHGTATLFEPPALVALPLVGSGPVTVRGAYRVVLEASAPRARWAVYVDAVSGAPLGREDQLRFDQASVLFDAPVRAPQLGRQSYPAPLLALVVDGAPLQTDAGGDLAWTSSGAPAAVAMDTVGPLVHVQNQAGLDATATLTGTDGTPILWSLASDEYGDAQLTSFIHAGLIKEHARGIAPAMSFLGAQLQVRPNEDDPLGCNAFWDGYALNFLKQSSNCNNSGRVADVVYHEFGHAFHQHAVIPGAGALDPALGEAAGDTMAVSYTHDPGMARGFYLVGDGALRQLDDLRRWPEDINMDPHETGIIWGGAMWDLRTYLIADLGDAAGNALTDQLYYQALRRSSDIPSTYAELLAADDDDGDLANGTPHVCAINRAFLRHGLAPMVNEAGFLLEHTPLTVVPPTEGPHPVTVTSTLLYPQCAAAGGVDAIELSVRLLGGGPSTDALTPQGTGWAGALPAVADGSALRYSLVAYADGNTTALPANPADPEYRVFVGATTPLYQNDFEDQIDGWTFSSGGLGAGDFEWGEPQGKASDPTAAFSGQKVIGDKLGGSGAYGGSQVSAAESPVVAVGDEAHVRLQFRRWLNVQDAVHDQATVYVNGQPAWQNAATDQGGGTLDHRDAEWRFEDIDVSPFLDGAGTVQVRFELASDKLGQLGGWNIDDFAIVAWHPAPPPSPDGGADAGGDGDAGDDPAAPAAGCGCAVPGGPADSAHGGAALAVLAGIASRKRRRGPAADRR
jgi:MYXO-CTERM domain-containing protein